jgi:2-polyprenyl-3-methyl-5-hydroxy-6-metoxy-1,4-benzoquinol methylase
MPKKPSVSLLNNVDNETNDGERQTPDENNLATGDFVGTAVCYSETTANKRQQKCIEIWHVRPSFVRALLDRLKMRQGQRYVDAGSGIGLLCLLIALTSGVDVFGIKLHHSETSTTTIE